MLWVSNSQFSLIKGSDIFVFMLCPFWGHMPLCLATEPAVDTVMFIIKPPLTGHVLSQCKDEGNYVKADRVVCNEILGFLNGGVSDEILIMDDISLSDHPTLTMIDDIDGTLGLCDDICTIIESIPLLVECLYDCFRATSKAYKRRQEKKQLSRGVRDVKKGKTDDAYIKEMRSWNFHRASST
ncbi:uncharacterized protein B0J16DRAFT_317805 [Fusarium flagelliforme]|uniref:uncharacterized protein n=1 Tax=Fusarium flagelliforme TaxID=2675880 RepID=UPI001E8DD80F|nr:uncharacterized protein B0J16DRAFT_317805 [Fusarium flagelliforme]KAH7188135.1 hypothetical protein B0J16DRAFT_317805 [Fusarium flagelliforme]